MGDEPGPWRTRRIALTGLYGWYVDHGADLVPLVRDIALRPAGAIERNRQRQEALVDSIVGDASGNPRLRAVVGHVAALSTWRSLAVEQGLSIDDATDSPWAGSSRLVRDR